jgi:hypothetical protein
MLETIVGCMKSRRRHKLGKFMLYNWVNFDGTRIHDANESIFIGGKKEVPVIEKENSTKAAGKAQRNRKKTQSVARSGFCVSNAQLSEGDIKVDVIFDEVHEHQTAEIMVQWVPLQRVHCTSEFPDQRMRFFLSVCGGINQFLP